MTERDEAILDTLTRRVRVLSVSQVAATWWSQAKQGRDQATARLRELQELALVTLVPILARPEPPLESPVLVWRPTDPEPDFGAVSYRLRSRWTLPARRIMSVIATQRAAKRFAGKGGRMPRASEATHDLCLAAIYLRLLTNDPRRAKRWISEADLFEAGEGRDDRLPDALIITRAGKTVIECGGAYSRSKVSDFHRFCVERGWGYELW